MGTWQPDTTGAFLAFPRALEWVRTFLQRRSVMADLNKKRKDTSPKMQMETFGKKKDQREVIIVSDDEDKASVAKEAVVYAAKIFTTNYTNRVGHVF